MKVFGISLFETAKKTAKAATQINKQIIELAQNNKKETIVKGKKRLSQKVLQANKLDIDVVMQEFLLAVKLAKDIQRPNRKPLYAIYDKIIERDSHLRSQLRTAHFTIQQSEFKILTNEKENTELKKLFETAWFTDFITYAIDQEFWGHSLVEFGYLYNNLFKNNALIDRYHVIPEYQSVILDITYDVTEGISYAENMENWFLLEIGNKRDLGLLLTAAIDIIYKNDARTDWASFNERFGMPLLSISTDTTNETELDELENMAVNFGSNGYVIGSKDTQFNIQQGVTTKSGHEKFNQKILLCDDYISKLINGQTATSDNQAYAGTAQVQERILNTYTKGRLQRIQRVINDKLIPFLKYHGYPLEAAKFQYVDLLKKEKIETVTGTDTEKKKSELKLNDDLHHLHHFYNLINPDINTIQLAFDNKLKGIFDKLISKIHSLAVENKLPKETQLLQIAEAKKLLAQTAKIYQGAIAKGIFSAKFKPDAVFIEKLTKNAWIFSGYKTQNQLLDIAAKLSGKDGKIIPFNKFRDEVLNTHKSYNERWLKTEYNQAISSSQQAAQWKQYEKGGDRYLLQYRTAADERVRASHAKLNEITLPVSNHFWDKHYPPNGWGCRCTQKEVLKSSYKESSQKQVKEKTDNFFAKNEQIFAYNPGKTAQPFPPKHPYYKLQQFRETINKVATIERNRAKFLAYGKEYIKHFFNEENGGFIVSHTKHGKNELTENINVGKIFALIGDTVELQSVSNIKGAKSADAILNGKIFEFKENKRPSKNAIDSAIRSAKNQADNIVLHVSSSIKKGDLINAVQSRLKRAKNIKDFVLIYNGKVIKTTRNEILKKGIKIE